MTTGTHDAMRALARLMREEKIASVRCDVVDLGRIEMALHPSAFSAAPAEPTAIPEDKPDCACGHDLATEHNEAGCLRGCALEACVPPDAPEEP